MKPHLVKMRSPVAMRDVCLSRELGHHVDVESLHDLFVEPGMVRLERLHQHHRRGRLHGAVELDADIHARAVLVAQRLEALDDLVDELLAFVVLERRALGRRASPTFIALTPVFSLTVPYTRTRSRVGPPSSL